MNAQDMEVTGRKIGYFLVRLLLWAAFLVWLAR